MRLELPSELSTNFLFSFDFDIVAKHTGTIRFLQNAIAENEVSGWNRAKYKYNIRDAMFHRMKLLTELRRIDYRQYEWVLENLDLQFKPKPAKENEIMIARKEGLRQLTAAYCADVKAKKLDDYRKNLHAQKVPHLEQKIKNLEFIRDEQKALRIPVTITQEQIDETRSQLDALRVEQGTNQVEPTKKKWKVF